MGTAPAILAADVPPPVDEEGLARDVIRAVQQARRDAGLDVSDRIRLTIGGREDAVSAARAWESLLASETLALEVTYGDAGGGYTSKVGDNSEVSVKVDRVK